MLLPLLIYVASWTGWLLHAGAYEQHLSDTQYGPYWGSYLRHDAHGFFPELWQSLRSLWHYHHDVYAFHTGFLNDSKHVYQSDPWGWLVLNRPVGVDAQLDIAARRAGLRRGRGLDLPAPGAAARQPGGVVVRHDRRAVGAWSPGSARRDWRYGLVVGRASRRPGCPGCGTTTGRSSATTRVTILPFLVLGATMLLGEMLGPRATPHRCAGPSAPPSAGSVVVLTMLAFAWFWPIWTDQLVTNREWVQRMWFRRWI